MMMEYFIFDVVNMCNDKDNNGDGGDDEAVSNMLVLLNVYM